MPAGAACGHMSGQEDGAARPDAGGDGQAHAEPTLVSSASTQPSATVVVQAPTAAVLGKQITSGSQSGSAARSHSSAQSNRSALTERRRRRLEEQKAPRPWPDDRVYNPRSLFLLTLQNPIRQTAIKMIEWKWWDTKVITIIMLNTVTLAMYDCFDNATNRPCNPEDGLSGPYGYCNKMGTGAVSLPPPRALREPPRVRQATCAPVPMPSSAPGDPSTRVFASRTPAHANTAGSFPLSLTGQVSTSRSTSAETSRTSLARSSRRTSPWSSASKLSQRVFFGARKHISPTVQIGSTPSLLPLVSWTSCPRTAMVATWPRSGLYEFCEPCAL